MENSKILKGDEARKFIAYEKLRRAGHCNMFDVKCVKAFTRLDREDVMLIIKNYNELSAKYSKELSRLEQ